MAEPFTIYKLTILFMLDKAGFPLTNTQISNFFLEQEYTDYFREINNIEKQINPLKGWLIRINLVEKKFESATNNKEMNEEAENDQTEEKV